MKSSSEIRFDYRNAIAQARALEDAADRVERHVAKRLSETAQETHQAWRGDSATIYINKLLNLQRQVDETARVLRDIAADIRRIARAIYQAEMTALWIAQQRKS